MTYLLIKILFPLVQNWKIAGVKLTVNRWTFVCIDLFQSIWHQLKFRVNELQLEANKATAKLFFGKASGTKKRTALLRKLFSFYKNVVFPAQAVYSYLPANFRVKMFLYYSQIIASNFSILECIENKLHWVNSRFFFVLALVANCFAVKRKK